MGTLFNYRSLAQRALWVLVFTLNEQSQKRGLYPKGTLSAPSELSVFSLPQIIEKRR
jgi:hypothetical protein